MKPDPRLRATLLITSDLDEMYRQVQLGRRGSHVQWKSNIEIDEATEGSLNWLSLSAEIGKEIQHLQQEKLDAPARKADADAKWELEQQRQQAEEAEREEQWRLEREREDAEQQEREQKWARQNEERKQQRIAREAREAELRAEVAARFNVSVDAFDYLIEAIAAEILRRREDCYGDD